LSTNAHIPGQSESNPAPMDATTAQHPKYINQEYQLPKAIFEGMMALLSSEENGSGRVYSGYGASKQLSNVYRYKAGAKQAARNCSKKLI